MEEFPVDVDINLQLYGRLNRMYNAVLEVLKGELASIFGGYTVMPIAYAVVHCIQNLGGVATPSEICRLLSRKHNSVSQLLTRMEKAGLITKTRDPEKKNMVRVRLTEKGLEVYNKTRASETAYEMFSVLSDEERQQFEEYVERISDKAFELLGKSLAFRFY